MTRLIIFDCDGTLVDSQHAIVAAMTYAFESHGLVPPTRQRTLSIVGLSLPEAFEVLAAEHDADTRASLTQGYRDGATAIRQRGETDVLYPGIAELIASLAADDSVTLGVATGKSHRGVMRLFDHNQWHDHFSTIQTADNNPSKPHPQMIISAMAETGASPETTVMIGDTSFDMTMARMAGVSALGVGWGYHEIAALNLAGAHHIAPTVTDLVTLLKTKTRD